MTTELWRWQSGRRNKYYDKMLLMRIPKFMDCWLIWYAKSAGIAWHTDKVEGKRHYRLNIVLINGGEFWLEWRPIKKRFIFFRPDIQEHSVKVIGENERRLVLSIGWVLPLIKTKRQP